MTNDYNLYDQEVGSRFHIYNSLFLNLPFRNILRTGTLLPLLQQQADAGLEKGANANDIVNEFIANLIEKPTREEQFHLLFNFIQYVERQVALFDSIEDAAFEHINDMKGKGTVSSLVMRAKYENKEAELRERLDEFCLRVVLTAHPTQFYPGFVLGILSDLEKSIREDDIPQINLLLRQLGKTAFINKIKPTPYDEAVSLLWYLENVFYTSVPQIILSLCDGLGISPSDWKNDKLITVGFWPGGDRDGNPFVTSSITGQVATKLKETLLKSYYRDMRMLRRRLTFQGIDSMVVEIEHKLYEMAYGQKETYTTPNEILIELHAVRAKLIKDHDGLFLELLDEFILRVRIFGFHFACLDIRQHSAKHEAVWKVIIQRLHEEKKSISLEEYTAKSEQDKIKHLLGLRLNLVFLSIEDQFTEEVIKTIQAISTVQKKNGEAGCHRYVISNCQSALQVMEVFVLTRLLMMENDRLPLDIVPLFETIDDLAHAATIMRELYSIDIYREHIRQRDGFQTIMLGFSDGTKDGGYLRANWSIFRAKEQLSEISREFGIKVVFFDGRGGPPARGGGNTHDFYASLGQSIEKEQVQITIQGQTISSNFGKLASCKYNLEQLLSAGIMGSVFESDDNNLSEESKALLDELAEEGYKAYLGLKNHPKFVPYLERITPLAFFGDTNVGSRPVKRSASEGLKFEDLRAIPFVGSWAMMKQNIPGFFGVGTAIEALIKKGKGEQLKELYKGSLFFRTLLGNSMMSLTKTNFRATNYLHDDKEFGEFWDIMNTEYELSIKKLLEVSGLSDLMTNNPMIRSSVSLREKIVLPLIVIQQYALMNLRNMREEDKKYEAYYRRLIIRCMFGIINAARNSA
ncbi:MAG TPA: phosphoenolpyruvate carboxylase [Cyclobacteriaceae bacterium]|nr:phosphoenolpyruvate carboxylase [Cyclobacteriaceae bacterium]